MNQIRQELPSRLAAGKVRVLKQYRGNGGNGVWKVDLAADVTVDTDRVRVTSSPNEMFVRARHAQRGCVEETLLLSEFLKRCEPYFSGKGRMIDQAYQPRLPEGMIRCYLVHNKVAGFGHQAINALYPAPPGAPADAAPAPMVVSQFEFCLSRLSTLSSRSQTQSILRFNTLNTWSSRCRALSSAID
jgi:hypothetical protein